MAPMLIGCVLIGFVVWFWRLTGQPPTVVASDDERIEKVMSLVRTDLASSEFEADVLIEMLNRMGLDGRDAVAAAGFTMPPDVSKSVWSVVQKADAFQLILTEALMVGVQVALIDDDYAGVGDEVLSDDARVNQAEIALFGDDRRERYTLYGKAALVLQDMLHDEPDGRRRDAVVALLGVFDDQVETLQEELDTAMAQVPDGDMLLWGDGLDRRMYYFKMGVINVLRRSGRLESLRYLYQLQGVNYNVEEAFQLAAKECPLLAVAERSGIASLIGMGPAVVQGWVRRVLKG